MIERILRLIKEEGITASKMSVDLGFDSGAVSNWKNGKAKPGTDAVVKIAAYFNVTTDYLLTGKEPQERRMKNERSDVMTEIKSFFTNSISLIIKALRLEQGLTVDAFVGELNGFINDIGGGYGKIGYKDWGFAVHLPNGVSHDITANLDPIKGIAKDSYMRVEDPRYSMAVEIDAENKTAVLNVPALIDNEASHTNENGIYMGGINYCTEDDVNTIMITSLYYNSHHIFHALFPSFPYDRVKYEPLSDFMLRVSGSISKQKLSLAELAGAIGLEEISIQSWLSGERQPSRYGMKRLALYLFPDDAALLSRLEAS